MRISDAYIRWNLKIELRNVSHVLISYFNQKNISLLLYT